MKPRGERCEEVYNRSARPEIDKPSARQGSEAGFKDKANSEPRGELGALGEALIRLHRKARIVSLLSLLLAIAQTSSRSPHHHHHHGDSSPPQQRGEVHLPD